MLNIQSSPPTTTTPHNTKTYPNITKFDLTLAFVVAGFPFLFFYYYFILNFIGTAMSWILFAAIQTPAKCHWIWDERTRVIDHKKIKMVSAYFLWNVWPNCMYNTNNNNNKKMVEKIRWMNNNRKRLYQFTDLNSPKKEFEEEERNTPRRVEELPGLNNERRWCTRRARAHNSYDKWWVLR